MSCSYLLRGWAISNHGIHVGIAYSALLGWGLTAGHARFLGTGLDRNGTLHPSGVFPSECLGTLPPLLACRRLVIMTAMLSSLRSISMFGISSQSFPKSIFFFFLEYCQQWTIFTLYFWKEKEKKKTMTIQSQVSWGGWVMELWNATLVEIGAICKEIDGLLFGS